MLNVSRSTALFWLLVLVFVVAIMAIVLGWLCFKILPLAAASYGPVLITAMR